MTFGIIVLNGEPFNRYCLRSIYPYAYEIIVVEGGHEATKAVTTFDGHSVDGTLENLYKFKEEEDFEKKVQIITQDGGWKKSDEYGHDRTHQSRAYAERASGDYLWQIDIDEFYFPGDMEHILMMLKNDSSITAVSFKTYLFWGAIDYRVDGWYFRRGADIFHRLFKWDYRYKYLTHEPPTVIDENGRDLRSIHWVSGEALSKERIRLYHYASLFPWQVKQKSLIYKEEKPELCKDIMNWAELNYLKLKKPFRVERHYWFPSWLERYKGEHPKIVLKMIQDIKKGLIDTEMRETDDIEKLLNTWWYFFGRIIYKLIDYLDRFKDRNIKNYLIHRSIFKKSIYKILNKI